MSTNKLKIDTGTINFWIKENEIQFNDSKTIPIFGINPEGGSIFMVKDNDNKLKVFYLVLEKGKVDIEVDVTQLSSEKKHMVTLTWDLVNKKLSLYIDSKEVATQQIPF